MRYLSVLLAACLALAAADCGGDARADVTPPKPKATSAFRVSAAVCVVSSCRLIASWTKGPNWNATTDSIRIDWKQLSPAVTLAGQPHYSKGTADTVFIPQPADGAVKKGTAQPCVFRKGIVGGACNTPAPWQIDGPAIQSPDTLQDVQITPASVTVAPGGQQQFSAVAS